MKMCYIHYRILVSCKENEIRKFVCKWIKLEKMIMKEVI